MIFNSVDFLLRRRVSQICFTMMFIIIICVQQNFMEYLETFENYRIFIEAAVFFARRFIFSYLVFRVYALQLLLTRYRYSWRLLFFTFYYVQGSVTSSRSSFLSDSVNDLVFRGVNIFIEFNSFKYKSQIRKIRDLLLLHLFLTLFHTHVYRQNFVFARFL